MSRTKLGRFKIIAAVDDPATQIQHITLSGKASFHSPQLREVRRNEAGFISKSECVLHGALLFTVPVSWHLLNAPLVKPEVLQVGAELDLEIDGEEVFIADLVAGGATK